MSRDPAFARVLYVTAADGDVWFNPTIGISDSPNYAADPDKSNALTQCQTMVSERPDGTDIGVEVQPYTLASW